MNFAALKAKAADGVKDARARATEPSRPTAKYKPVRPEDLAGQRQLSAGERYQQSTVLQHQQAIHRPPPPPIRSRSSGGSPATTSANEYFQEKAASPPPAPARKYGAPAAPAPAPPPRTPSTSGAPPAPPPRSGSTRSIPAPPYQHAITHDLPKPAPPPRSTPAPPAPAPRQALSASTISSSTETFKKFSEYDSADKELMFSMLDEFFEARLAGDTSKPMPEGFAMVGSTPRAVAPVPGVGRAHASTTSHSAEPAPPPLAHSTRPSMRGASSSSSSPAPSSGPSYPPPEPYSSSALTIAHYLTDTAFPSPPWYSLPTASLPPPLEGRSDVRFTGSWSQRGTEKSVLGFVLFGDASCAWWKISFDVARPADARREVRYRPRPGAWDGERLYAASERYGPGMVAFAHAAVASRIPVARGECWDVAAEGLTSVGAQLPEEEEPFPSIARTHGHLLYWAKATSDGSAKGVWRGGDVYVRPGDVVEWRRVKIKEVGAPAGSYSTLGDPDHTAIITSAAPPTSIPTLSDALTDETYPLASLVSLTVVEQSQGVAPAEKTYDLAAMSEGEVWIYRPVGLGEYVGSAVDASWPPKCESWQVGELE